MYDSSDAKTLTLHVGSRIYHWPRSADAVLHSVQRVLEEEERRVLELLPLFERVPEHFLIHQIRMYMFRFAVPAIEIEAGGLNRVSLDRVRERLWLCMLGRALDDIVDGDSVFFDPGESALLLTTYHGLLLGTPSAPTCESLGAAVRRSPNVGEAATVDQVRDDVCRRVQYYLEPTIRKYPDRLPALRKFVGVTLGGCDLDDALADTGAAATILSRELRHRLADDEQKVRLGADLFRWYICTASRLLEEACVVRETLEADGAAFAVSVIADECCRLKHSLDVCLRPELATGM